MKPISLKLEVSPQTPEETAEVIEAVLEALVVANMAFYRRFPDAVCCPKCGGVKYTPPTPAEAATHEQRFVGVERLLVQGHAACGDVAAMICARMRVLEGKPDARCRVIQQGAARRYHAVVQDGDEYIDATEEMQPGDAPGCACGG